MARRQGVSALGGRGARVLALEDGGARLLLQPFARVSLERGSPLREIARRRGTVQQRLVVAELQPDRYRDDVPGLHDRAEDTFDERVGGIIIDHDVPFSLAAPLDAIRSRDREATLSRGVARAVDRSCDALDRASLGARERDHGETRACAWA